MKRLIGLVIVLVAQWVGFALLEGSDPAGAGGVVLYFLNWLGDAVRRGGPIIAAALATAAAMRVRGLDVSVVAMAMLAAVAMSRFDYGPAFWWTAAPTGAAVIAGVVVVNAVLGWYVRGPLLLLTLGAMVVWRAMAFALEDTSKAPPFLMVPGYEWFGYAGSTGMVLVGLFVVGWLLLRAADGGRLSGSAVGRGGYMAAWAVVGLAAMAAAVLETSRTGEAWPMALAGFEMHAVTAALLAGAAVGSAGWAVAAVWLAGLNMAVFAEGMYALAARYGTIGGVDPQQVQFFLLAPVALAAAWAWRRHGRRRTAEPSAETAASDAGVR